MRGVIDSSSYEDPCMVLCLYVHVGSRSPGHCHDLPGDDSHESNTRCPCHVHVHALGLFPNRPFHMSKLWGKDPHDYLTDPTGAKSATGFILIREVT